MRAITVACGSHSQLGMRRYETGWRDAFPIVVAFGIRIAAYFQALGLSRLIGAVLGGRSAPVARTAAAVPAPTSDHAEAADEILERNPFDSFTGPLNRRILDHPAFRPAGRPGDPPCDGARVVLI